jgi:hypothetical protein
MLGRAAYAIADVPPARNVNSYFAPRVISLSGKLIGLK